jgi:hypothetical protein
MGKWMKSSTFSWSQQQFEVSGQFHALAFLTLGKEPGFQADKRLSYVYSLEGDHWSQAIQDGIQKCGFKSKKQSAIR